MTYTITQTINILTSQKHWEGLRFEKFTQYERQTIGKAIESKEYTFNQVQRLLQKQSHDVQEYMKTRIECYVHGDLLDTMLLFMIKLY